MKTGVIRSSSVPASRGSGFTTFAALRYRNYRLWFVGQALSLMGTWMQSVAQGWVVYQITGSRFALGAISFASTIPTLFLMLPAGAVADRVSRRNLLIWTQTAMMLCAFILTALTATGVLQVWHVAVLAFALGVANSFDAPARQSLAVEMVEDRRDLMNAIALNSTMFNLGRVVGPAIGGVVLAALGPAWCFGLNGISFLAVIGALLGMRLPPRSASNPREPLVRQIAIGLRYVLSSAPVRTIVLLMAVSTLFGFSYSTLMPAYAVDVLRVGETGLGFLTTSVGIGALVSSLTVASLGHVRRKGRLLLAGSCLFPAALLGFAFSRSFPLSLALLAVAGFGFVLQNTTSNTVVQMLVPDHLRGRVMAVYTLTFFGTMPFGSLLVGSIAQVWGPTAGVAMGAAVTLACALWILLAQPAMLRLTVEPSPTLEKDPRS
ncbi:MAG: MFS transporter [Thermoflexales bacterium]|nr:MFS transporter [Thermoflexales bacterium]